MALNPIVLILIAILIACGIYLLLERTLTKMLVGLLLIDNAVNILLLIVSGPRGKSPIFDPSLHQTHDNNGYSDSLAQAIILTSIVISMGIAAFILALTYKSYYLARTDEVADDPEDTKISQQTISQGPDKDKNATWSGSTTLGTGKEIHD